MCDVDVDKQDAMFVFQVRVVPWMNLRLKARYANIFIPHFLNGIVNGVEMFSLEFRSSESSVALELHLRLIN